MLLTATLRNVISFRILILLRTFSTAKAHTMSTTNEEPGFEPHEYMGLFLMVKYKQKPALAEYHFLEKVGVYDKYGSDIPFYCYLIDEDNGHYFLAREELDGESERTPF